LKPCCNVLGLVANRRANLQILRPAPKKAPPPDGRDGEPGNAGNVSLGQQTRTSWVRDIINHAQFLGEKEQAGNERKYGGIFSREKIWRDFF
jgi:hypothetical protein